MVTIAEMTALILAGVAILGLAYTFWKDSKTRDRVDLLASAVSAIREIVSKQQEHLGLKKDELQWNQLAGIAKAFGWAFDRGFFAEDDEEFDE